MADAAVLLANVCRVERAKPAERANDRWLGLQRLDGDRAFVDLADVGRREDREHLGAGEPASLSERVRVPVKAGAPPAAVLDGPDHEVGRLCHGLDCPRSARPGLGPDRLSRLADYDLYPHGRAIQKGDRGGGGGRDCVVSALAALGAGGAAMTVDERRQALEHVRRQMAMLTEQDEFRDEGRTDHGM